MTRRRFLYTDGGRPLDEPVEVTPDYERYDAKQPVFTDRHHEGQRAPDGTDIGSRRKRAEYMRLNGLADADDFKGSWVKARQERDNFFTGKGGASREIRETVGRAAYELQRGKR